MRKPRSLPDDLPRGWRGFKLRMTLGPRMLSASAALAHEHLHAVGLIEDRRPAGFTRIILRLLWVAAVVGVCFVPTTSEEVTVYFPAILTLGATWLLAMPAYALAIAKSENFGEIRLHGVAAKFFEALQRQQIVLPHDLTSESTTQEADTLLQEAAPALFPAMFGQMFCWVAFRALTLCVFGVIGLVAGPLLVGAHWIRGWSPVAVVIALPAPALCIVLGSLLVPFITLNYLTQLRLQHVELTGHAAASATGVDHAETPART